jgi:hypothetical protein
MGAARRRTDTRSMVKTYELKFRDAAVFRA